MRKWLDIATLENTKNLKGEFVARCAAGSPFFLEEGMELHFVPPRIDAPRFAVIKRAVPIKADRGRVTFEGLNDPAVADLLVGCHCLIEKDNLSEELLREISLMEDRDDLMGWSLFDNETFVGFIADIEERPNQPLLVVTREDSNKAGNVLIPLVEDLIVEIDEKDSRLVMNLPSGLLEL